MQIGNIISTGTIEPATTITAREILADIIREHGPIPTARVSSAQARGAAKKYPYWGVVRYEIRLRADGRPSNMPCERASSDTRSEAKAERMLDELCEREGRLEMQAIGEISEQAAAAIIERLARAAEMAVAHA